MYTFAKVIFNCLLLKQIIAVLKKDVVLEWRNKFTIAGIAIQVLTSVFIVYLAIPALNLPIQNSLFWIILVLSCLNAVTKGFIAEPIALQNYLQQLVPSRILIRSKLAYNFLLITGITFLIWLVFNLLIGEFPGNQSYYLGIVLLSSLGISSAFTLMSALVRKLPNAYLIVPVISLPIIIPILIIGINASKKALDGLSAEFIQKDLLLLGSICIFAVIMCEILYVILDKN